MARALACVLPCLLGGCLATGQADRDWSLEVAYASETKLGGVAVGDLDPERPGDEIAVVSANGQAHLLWREVDGTWGRELIAEFEGEKVQCAVGDLDPRHRGDELVLVGARRGGEDDADGGRVVYATRAPEGWTTGVLFEEEELIHAVCVGDIDPEREGLEILVGGYTGRAHVLAIDPGGVSIARAANLDAHIKGAAAGRGGAVLASSDGSVREVRRMPSGWRTYELERFEDPQARIAVAPAGPGRDGDILVCGDGGQLRLLGSDPRTRTTTVLAAYRSPDRLRGAVFADIDPEQAGVEMATAGYDGWMLVVYPVGRGARSLRVGKDSDRLHSLASGSISGLGTCLVACGYSGRVLVAYKPFVRREP